jgi:hypothetical protein
VSPAPNHNIRVYVEQGDQKSENEDETEPTSDENFEEPQADCVMTDETIILLDALSL